MGKEHILVVDDDQDFRVLVVDLLSNLGYQCHAAENGRNALEAIRKQNFDIIISDIKMPNMDGLALIEEVRKNFADLPFIVVTGYSGEYSYDRVMGAGANDFIRKPFTSQELQSKLVRIFKERKLAKDNLTLLQEQKHINKKLSTLLEAGISLTAELDLERLFPLIISHVTEAMEAERTSLYLIDGNNRELWTKVAEQVDQIRLPLGEGISGRVAETGEEINVDDAWELPFFNREFDIKHSFRTRSVLCIPVYNRTGDRIAVLQVINKKGKDRFEEEDVSLLKSMSSHVAFALENAQLMDEVQLSFESSIRTLSATVDAKHPLTAGHSQRVTDYSLMIAREMGLDAKTCEVIKYAGLLHDIGKIGIKDNIMLKAGPFTPEERAEMAEHTTKTLKILENFRFPKALDAVPFVAAHHHEKFNGEGYPDGLKKNRIPLVSRILTVADVFDALTSPRDYPKYATNEKLGYDPMPIEKAISILKNDSGTHFDPKIVTAFLVCLPQALLQYRETHFPPTYVDKAIQNLAPGLLTKNT